VDGVAAERAACLQEFRHRMTDISIRTELDDS
jgi:hypothetical protein